MNCHQFSWCCAHQTELSENIYNQKINKFTKLELNILQAINCSKNDYIAFFSPTTLQQTKIGLQIIPIENSLSLLAAYRSSKLICQATNALKLYRMLNRQECTKDLNYGKRRRMEATRNIPLTTDGKMETLFLSPEQLCMLKSPAQHQIV